MKILITGVNGFIGLKVLAALKKIYTNDEIIALSSTPVENTRTILHNNYKFDKNIFLNNKCEDIDILIHVGAFIPKSGKSANLIEENTTNIYNTQKLLLALNNLKKIIFISTVDIYKEDDIITESTLENPISLYGWSKLYCEKMVQIYAKENDIVYQILRLGHVFGPGEEKYQKILPLTIKKVINNEDIEIWGDGKAIRTFIYIEDVVQAIVNALNLSESKIINIVGEEQVTIADLIKKIIGISQKNINIKYIPSNTPNRNLIFDNSKLKKYLIPNLTSLQDGLIKEYQYMEKLYENIL